MANGLEARSKSGGLIQMRSEEGEIRSHKNMLSPHGEGVYKETLEMMDGDHPDWDGARAKLEDEGFEVTLL